MKINVFEFTFLQKLEFADCAKGIINISNKYDVTTLHIEGYHQSLLKYQPQVDALIVKYGKHPLTLRINELWAKLNKLTTAINSQIVSVEKAGLASLEQERITVLPFLHRIFNNLRVENRKTTNEKMQQLSAKLIASEEFVTAANKLGFELLIGEMLVVWKEFTKLSDDRVKCISQREPLNTVNYKRNIARALRNFLKGVELAMWQYGEEGYEPLVNELNVFMGAYATLIKSRATQNKNKASESVDTEKQTVALSENKSATA